MLKQEHFMAQSLTTCSTQSQKHEHSSQHAQSLSSLDLCKTSACTNIAPILSKAGSQAQLGFTQQEERCIKIKDLSIKNALMPLREQPRKGGFLSFISSTSKNVKITPSTSTSRKRTNNERRSTSTTRHAKRQ